MIPLTIPINQLLLGDNLKLMSMFPSGSVDLIYLDPPFNSQRNFAARIRKGGKQDFNADEAGFADVWRSSEEVVRVWESFLFSQTAEVRRRFDGLANAINDGGALAYMAMLAPRLVELKRILKDVGSIYLHCDRRMAAPLKLTMDIIFGADCFINKLVWCYGLGGSSRRRWPHKHDDILWYARNSKRHYFNPVYIPATSRRMRGQLKKAPDYWLIPAINNMSHERTGWPTQKPLALLERIVTSSCPDGGIVLDPFCGSGTSLVAAARTGRRWIGMDISRAALSIVAERLERISGGKIEIAA